MTKEAREGISKKITSELWPEREVVSHMGNLQARGNSKCKSHEAHLRNEQQANVSKEY